MHDFPEKDTIEFYIHGLSVKHGGRTAFLWKGSYRTRRLTYASVYDYARRAAALLESMGIEKGDRICLLADSSPSWAILFFGCLLKGVVVVPIDVRSDDAFVQTVIGRVSAKAVLLSGTRNVDAPIAKLRAEKLLERLQELRPLDTSELPDITPDDIVEIVYTSGTTSAPKGVIITNRNLVSNIRGLRYVMPFDESYRLLSVLPLSHVFEQVLGLFYPLRFGASVLYTSTRKPSALSKLMRKHRITTIVCVPFFLDSFRDALVRGAGERGREEALERLVSLGRSLPFWARRSLSVGVRSSVGRHIRFFIVGGARLAPATEDFWTGLGIRVIQGYGLTEASPVVSCNTVRRYKPYTAGLPIPGQVLRIADDGEILVRGPHVTPGYYEDAEATEAAFVDGWLRTGDIGELDAEGFLTIRDRKKDVIIGPSGLNVYPRDIEAVLDEDAAVRGSCVVGIEDDGRTRIYAAVIPEPGSPDTIEDIVARANGLLDSSRRIQEAGFWPGGDFPRTASLKVKKHEVARTVEGMRGTTAPDESACPESRRTWELRQTIAGLLRIQVVDVRDDARLAEDLVLDSLGLVELVVLLQERFNLDSPVLLRSLPVTLRRRTAVAAAADYFFGFETESDERPPLARKILPVIAPLVLNAFPFARRRSVRRSLEPVGELLDDEWSIILYPEGTRSETGKIASFMPGIGLIASEMGVPVIPVRLEGLHEILPKGSVLPRRGVATATFGAPLVFAGRRDYGPVAATIERSLRALHPG